jgi:tRNA threonylcarbamoyladenosine biosynthesis protein TsaE
MRKRRVHKVDIYTVAKQLVADCEKRSSKWASVVALCGELGTGKTTLTKSIAKVFGIKTEITSPTFVIEKIYGIPQKTKSRFSRLIHIDAYRLERGSELDALGWHEIVNDPSNIIFVEWPENVKESLPEDTIWVKLSHVDDTIRDIEW